jgi:hypothetical protein
VIVDALRADGPPVVGVSYGGNDPAEAEMPLGELVDAAKADSLWQLLMLQGAAKGCNR